MRLAFFNARKNWIIGLLISCSLVYIGYTVTINSLEKKSTMAGFANGSLVDYCLLLYEDSTYFLSTLAIKQRQENIYFWSQINDTILLKIENKVSAKLLGNTIVEINQPEYNCLRIMEFKYFQSPKLVSFPKDN